MMSMNWSRPLNGRGPGGGHARARASGIFGSFGASARSAAAPTFMIRSPGLQAGPLGRRLRVDVADLDPRLRVVAHRAARPGSPASTFVCGGGQLDVLELLDLVAALHLEGDRLPLVLRAAACAGAGPGSGPACRRPRRCCRPASGRPCRPACPGRSCRWCSPSCTGPASRKVMPSSPALQRDRLLRRPVLQLRDDLASRPRTGRRSRCRRRTTRTRPSRPRSTGRSGR